MNIHTLAEQVVSELSKKHFTISTAESCTGGMLSSTITSVPGSSAIFQYGFVTYSEDAKKRVLELDADVLKCGTVSPEITEAMATGARKISRSDISVAITGYAGPEGGTQTIPVGTAFIAVCGATASELIRRQFEGTRNEVREQITEVALQLVLEFLKR